MAEEKPKGAPPVTPKQKSIEQVSKYGRANTGGDPYDRSRGNYSKNPPSKDPEVFGDF